jgi:hypothetical protein
VARSPRRVAGATKAGSQMKIEIESSHFVLAPKRVSAQGPIDFVSVAAFFWFLLRRLRYNTSGQERRSEKYHRISYHGKRYYSHT